MREYTEEQVEQISGAIITSFINLHFLEEAERSGLFKHRVKKNVRRTIEDLIDIERDFFNQIEKADEDNLSDKIIDNKLSFISFLLKMFRFNDFYKMQEIAVAYSLDREAISKISDEILIKNGAKDEKTIDSETQPNVG